MRKTIFWGLAFILSVSIWGSDKETSFASYQNQSSKSFFVTGNTLLAGSQDGKWISAKDSEKHITGKETFVFYSFDKKLGIGENARIERYENGTAINIKRNYTMSFSEEKFFGLYINELGLSGYWNALPRIPRIQTGNLKVYEDVIKGILQDKSLPQSRIEIKRVIRVDIEGDGTEEVLITATDWNLDSWLSSGEGKGSYSIVVLRKIINGKVKTIILRGQFAKDKPEYEYVFYTPLILDLNNDGKMEVIIEGRWHAWSKIEFYEIINDKVKQIYTTAFGA